MKASTSLSKRNDWRMPTCELLERSRPLCILAEQPGWIRWYNRQPFSRCSEAFLMMAWCVHLFTRWTNASLLEWNCWKASEKVTTTFCGKRLEHCNRWAFCCNIAQNGTSISPGDSWSIPQMGCVIVFAYNSFSPNISFQVTVLSQLQAPESSQSCWCCFPTGHQQRSIKICQNWLTSLIFLRKTQALTMTMTIFYFFFEIRNGVLKTSKDHQ